MQEIDKAAVKDWAIRIVGHVTPGDAFVVEDAFDIEAEDWHKAGSQDEGRFVGGLEASTFAAVIVPFLLGFFGDVAKDIVKDQIKISVGALIERQLKRKTSGDETAQLKRQIDTAISNSRFSDEQKQTLRAGFEILFMKLGTAD